MAERFPIKVKEVTITSEEYDATIKKIDELEAKIQLMQNLFDKLDVAGLKLPYNALECDEFMIRFNEVSREVSIIGR